MFFQMQEFLLLAGQKARDGDARPLGHDPGDVVLGHLLAQERALAVACFQLGLGLFLLLAQFPEPSIAQLRGLGQVLGPLGRLGLPLRLADARFDLLELPDPGLLLGPLFLQLDRFRLHVRQLRLQRHEPFLGGLVLLLLQRETFHLQLQEAASQLVELLGL